MTWGELRAHCEEVLANAGRERPARVVLDWFDDGYGRASRMATELVPRINVIAVETQLAELLEGRPLQYVTGVSHFYGLELEVGEGVLIPRPETEELVRWILESHPLQPALHFADLCCGSGCIAVALARKRLTWTGEAVDVSGYALDFTRRNLAKHDVAGAVRVVRADVLEDGSVLQSGWYDIIVSNPPYIPDGDWGRVGEEVAAWEPEIALRVGDEEPLVFYDQIERLARAGLKAGGWLYFECNDRYAGKVAALLRERRWGEVEVLTDMQGRERHVRGRRPPR